MAINWKLVDPDLHDSIEWAHSKVARSRGNNPEKIYLLLIRDSKKFSHVALQYLEEGKLERWMIRQTKGKEIRKTWSEMLKLLRPLIGDRAVMEVYPRDCDIVDTAAVRHFWVLPDGLQPHCDLRTVNGVSEHT